MCVRKARAQLKLSSKSFSYLEGNTHEGCKLFQEKRSQAKRLAFAGEKIESEGTFSHLCENPGHSGGQKATLGGRILWIDTVATPFPPPNPPHIPSKAAKKCWLGFSLFSPVYGSGKAPLGAPCL